jgi:putative hydrolase of the HAD superfamily
MTRIVLFDWGDTLMRDIPGAGGKMRDWPEVAAMPGAKECLRHLSRTASLYVATGAKESTAADIRAALRRVGLDHYLSGCFCRQNTGFQKPDPRFYLAILASLGVTANDATMIGDSLENDILPCHALGMHTALLASAVPAGLPKGVRVIGGLTELCL